MANVTTKPGRLSYVYLIEPHVSNFKDKGKDNAQEPKYELDFIMDPDTPDGRKNIKLIEAATEEAIEKAVASFKPWNGRRPKELGVPLKDGDARNEKAEENGREAEELYAGVKYITAKNKNQPQVVQLVNGKLKLVDPSKAYAGCFSILSLSFFPYANSGNKGISIGLEGVLFHEDGERLGGGGTNALEAFKAFESDGDDENYDPQPAKTKKKSNLY